MLQWGQVQRNAGRGACRRRACCSSPRSPRPSRDARSARRRSSFCLRPGYHLHAGHRRSASSPPRSPTRPSAADFKFTPAAPRAVRRRCASRSAPGADRRAAAPPISPRRFGQSAIGALTPASYNLGVAVGWRRFAVAGDVAKSRSRQSGPRRARGDRGRRRQLFAEASVHRPGRGRRRAQRRHARPRRWAARQLFARCRRRLLADPQHRGDRRRPLQDRARPRRPRSRTSAATARRSTSAPPLSSKTV